MGQVKVDCTPISVQQLTASEIKQMFALFEQYYEAVSYEAFCKDLFKKDQVLLAREKSTWAVKGFTTLQILNLDYVKDGRKHHATGIFSGDTIVAPEYWGQRVINGAFASTLLREKMKRPFDELYWFLISKGYKTYLLLTNNFVEYYPRHDKATPAHIQGIIDSYAMELYPQAYDKTTGLLRFEESLGHLKGSVAPITNELLAKHPKIAFFQERNPNWEKGDELVCLGVVNWRLFAGYALKSARYAVRGFLGAPKRKTARSEA